MMERMNELVEKYSMPESCKRDMLEILNESLLEISKGILERKVSKEVGESSKSVKSVKKEKEGTKRYKSKKAEEYAEEHGINIDEFEMLEISKKDVENKVREMTKNNKEGKSEIKSIESKSSESKKSGEIKREKVICSGINKKGECCKSTGTIQPEGAKKKYCFRHAEDFRSFECDSDSSDEEEMVEEEMIKEPETKKLEINSDDE